MKLFYAAILTRGYSDPMELLKKIFAHPLTRGLNIDDANTSALRLNIIQEKGLLRRIYEDWYSTLQQQIPNCEGLVLELGSGAGFLTDFLPELVTSDILLVPNVQVVLDAHELPFATASLSTIVMVDVLHHLRNVRRFFHEAARCVKGGGRIIMIEPWVTSWSRFVYGRLHHEPFSPECPDWTFDSGGVLSGANLALPWIIFERDLQDFERSFPMWTVKTIELEKPFMYLLSGGVSLRALFPKGVFDGIRFIERLMRPWLHRLAMFALIVLVRER